MVSPPTEALCEKGMMAALGGAVALFDEEMCPSLLELQVSALDRARSSNNLFLWENLSIVVPSKSLECPGFESMAPYLRFGRCNWCRAFRYHERCLLI